MKEVMTLAEAQAFFLSNHDEGVLCIRPNGKNKECWSYPEAVAFFEQPPIREDGWYWVKQSITPNDTAWSIMYYSDEEWIVSGCEWVTYTDSDLLEIEPTRLKSPDERACR